MDNLDARTIFERRLRRTTGHWDRLPILIALIRELSLSDPIAAQHYTAEVYTLAKELNDPFWTGMGLSAASLSLMRTAEYSTCIPMLQKASDIFARLNELHMKFTTDIMIAQAHIELREHTSAMSLLLEALGFFKRAKAHRSIVHVLLAIGDVYRQVGDWQKALKCYRRMGKIITESELNDLAADLYHRLATSYRMMEDNQHYHLYMVKSLKVYRLNGNMPGVAVAIGNIGNSYMDQERYAEAEKYVRQAGRLYRKFGYTAYEAMNWARLGTIYEHFGEFDKAYRYFRKGIQRIRGCDDPLIRGLIYQNFGGLCIRMGCTEKGLRYLHRALAIIDRTEQPSYRHKAYTRLAEAYETTGDMQKALAHYKESARIKEGYIDSKKIMQASRAEMKAKLKPLLQRIREERTKNNRLMERIERKEAELRLLTLKMVQDEEERSTTKRRGTAKRAGTTTAHRSEGLSKNWETFAKQFHRIHRDFYTTLIRRYPVLTPAEVKVCSLIRIGLSSKEIAGVLCISQRTVESHRTRIHKKMELPARTNLAGFIVKL